MSNRPPISNTYGRNILPSFSFIQEILKKHTGIDEAAQFILGHESKAGPLYDLLASLWPQFQELERLLDENGAKPEIKEMQLGAALFSAIQSNNPIENFDESIKIVSYILMIRRMINSVSAAIEQKPEFAKRTLIAAMFRQSDDS